MLGFHPLASQPLNSSGNFVPVLVGTFSFTLDGFTAGLTGSFNLDGAISCTLDTITGTLIGNLPIATDGQIIVVLDAVSGAFLGTVDRFSLITTNRPLVGAITTNYN